MKTLKHVNKYFRLKLFYGYRYFLVKFFFFSLKLKILFITIIFLNLLIDRKKNKKFHGLALGRSIFNEDIKVLNKTSDIVSYDNLSGSFFNYLITEYVSKDILKKSIIQYQLDIKNRKMIYELISKVIYWLLKLNKYDFIINCNYDYLRHQEIAQYCVDNSIPYLVFYKEGINSKKFHSNVANYQTKTKFIGTKLFVPSKGIKNAFINAGDKDLTTDNVAVIGVPRLNNLVSEYTYRSKDKIQKVKQVLLLSFTPEEKLTYHNENSKKYISEIAKKMHLDILNCAKKYTDIEFIIKTKVPKHYRDYVLNIFSDQDQIPKNLRITSEGSSINYVFQSDIIYGFYTTVLLEAYISNKIILTIKGNDKIGIEEFFDKEYFGVNFRVDDSTLNNLILDHKANDLSIKRSKYVMNEFFEVLDSPNDLIDKEIVKVLKK